MKDFIAMMVRRTEAADGFNHPVNQWRLSDWFTATLGELGEAANVAKKLKRIEDDVGVAANKGKTKDELLHQLKLEIGDTGLYLILLSYSLGFDLDDAMIEAFNRKSIECHMPYIFMK